MVPLEKIQEILKNNGSFGMVLDWIKREYPNIFQEEPRIEELKNKQSFACCLNRFTCDSSSV